MSNSAADSGAGAADDESWTSDSKSWNCVDALLEFDDRVGPRLVPDVHIQSMEGAELRIGDRTFSVEDFDHCSDCYDRMFDREAMRLVRDRAHLLDLSIIAPDGKHVLYNHKPNSDQLELAERDIETDNDRVLTSHSGTEVVADNLRASPDGRFLAYQLSTGYTFVKPPKLYFLDLETLDRWYVGEHVFGTMHWTSDSKRLYFAQRDGYGPLEIRYVEPPRDENGSKSRTEPDTTKAETNPPPSEDEAAEH